MTDPFDESTTSLILHKWFRTESLPDCPPTCVAFGSLEGNFEGIGVQFNILNDTVLVIKGNTVFGGGEIK